jgi:hypothetical protein
VGRPPVVIQSEAGRSMNKLDEVATIAMVIFLVFAAVMAIWGMLVR